MSESRNHHFVLIPFKNHHSPCLDLTFIDNYIAQEQAAGCYSQAFTPETLKALIRPFCTSLLGLIPKPHSDSLWLIQDMSFPRDDPLIHSVNAGINSDDFPTTWGNFEDTAELILSLPEGCLAVTFDILAAYCLTPIHPDQQSSLCLLWDGKVYVDRAVMFSLFSSAGVFGAVADMLVDIYVHAGFGAIQKWVDDFLIICSPHQHWSEQDFTELTSASGVPWSHKKTRPLLTCQWYIGFLWDLPAKS